ncbi:hypothetical protein TVAGG3_0188740 [Trichomonas vaginalis G3]|uniref:hypothetical protein n=1 Tax=Trichomonas vaginalis (strain ATCC PRA-98 / G3) TaxID=412133 RepID=UPI0021E5B001|nr:hypothetical protein TVAGG3_0188740 [Trichomonas vaginalis G3]KAI5549820.1 hypothetical protein TVAGG3_0188740 [Trichomonas vaginalis G3]
MALKIKSIREQGINFTIPDMSSHGACQRGGIDYFRPKTDPLGRLSSARIFRIFSNFPGLREHTASRHGLILLVCCKSRQNRSPTNSSTQQFRLIDNGGLTIRGLILLKVIKTIVAGVVGDGLPAQW